MAARNPADEVERPRALRTGRGSDRHRTSAAAARASRAGLVASWEKIQRVAYSPRVLQGLPPFAASIARSFWDTDSSDVIRAIKAGDVALFVAFQIRLDQIDCAMVSTGLTIADRAPVTRIKYMLEGFRQAAEEQLVKKGGVWPPATGDEP